MSQPGNRNCNIAQPGEVDETLNEFWVGDPWRIFQENNLSSFERNRLFLNVAGENFVDVSYVSGADTDSDSRSAVPIDVNNDGMLDMAVRNAGGRPLHLYENHMPQRGWLKVTLRGEKSNRLGLGTRLIAHVGELRMTRELYPYGAFRSQAPSYAHFGLGDAGQVDRLVLLWPSGAEQELTRVSANQHIVVDEGREGFEVVEPGKPIAP